MADEGKQSGGDAWGDDISDERKAELEQRLQAWEQEADHGERRGPFDSITLTGADVFWLAARTLTDMDEARAVAQAMDALLHAQVEDNARLRFNLSTLHLEGADLSGAHLGHAVLSHAHLERVNLTGAYLEQADLSEADLEQARCDNAHLEMATPSGARGKGAIFYYAHMRRANLVHGEFPAAGFAGADLAEATFGGADLRQADFATSDLRGANMPYVQLGGADMRRCRMDATTELSGAYMGDKNCGFPIVANALWGDANVAAVNWSVDGLGLNFGEVNRHVILGDETLARNPPDFGHIKAGLDYGFGAAIRAYRQFAAILRNQGANEQANELMYRAQLVQLRVLRRQAFWRKKGMRVRLSHRLRPFATYLGSGLLDLIAGYGYRPGRSIVAYIIIICGFAGLYLLNGQFASPHLRWDEALVLSISSFHGRGFFTSGVSLGDTLARLASGEAIVGLLLEITFIATFTNRFFAR